MQRVSSFVCVSNILLSADIRYAIHTVVQLKSAPSIDSSVDDVISLPDMSPRVVQYISWTGILIFYIGAGSNVERLV